MFYQMVKRVSIDVCEFMALLLGLLFFYFKMYSFVHAAVMLGYVNGQTVTYLIYAILLVLLPIVLLVCFRRLNKASILRLMFYAFAVVILVGTVFDIVTYDWFIDYMFIEGDAVFVNLMWNMPNMFGIVHSVLMATLYFMLGKQIKRKRRLSLVLIITIFILSNVPPIIYSFASSGTWPRETFLQKSIYILAIQIFLLAAFSIAATSRNLWKQHIWN